MILLNSEGGGVFLIRLLYIFVLQITHYHIIIIAGFRPFEGFVLFFLISRLHCGHAILLVVMVAALACAVD